MMLQFQIQILHTIWVTRVNHYLHRKDSSGSSTCILVKRLNTTETELEEINIFQSHSAALPLTISVLWQRQFIKKHCECFLYWLSNFII